MPRLSLYRSEKGNDYKFMDKQIYEMFTIGGTDVFVHKYLGPADPADPSKPMGEFTIQDVLFLENRDRKYDPTVYRMRGVYNVQDIDFNLSQFGLFLQNDTIFMTVHINNTVETIGRKIMSGDVIELPHLKDDFAMNDFKIALKRFYVVEDVTRAAEGFAATWWPHLYRLKLKPLVDSQEFKDIINTPIDEDNFAGDYDTAKTYYPGQVIRWKGVLYTVTQQCTGIDPPNTNYFTVLDPTQSQASAMSDYLKILAINESVIAEAEKDAPKSGYDTQHFYTLSLDENGNSALVTVNQDDFVNQGNNTTDAVNRPPIRDGYDGYLLGDGYAPNGVPFGFGIQFPNNAVDGDFYLRTDYFPNRLFRFDGKRWIKYEDLQRMTLRNTDDRQTQKFGFINNTATSNVNSIDTDTFIVADPMSFRTNDRTLLLDITAKKIVTKVAYSASYGVEVYQNEHQNPVVSKINENGKLAFTLKNAINVSDTIRWSVYRDQIQQRQSLSKALRPRADF